MDEKTVEAPIMADQDRKTSTVRIKDREGDALRLDVFEDTLFLEPEGERIIALDQDGARALMDTVTEFLGDARYPEMVIQGLIVTPQGRQDVPALAQSLRADGFDVFEVSVCVSSEEPERFRIRARWPEGTLFRWQKGEA